MKKLPVNKPLYVMGDYHRQKARLQDALAKMPKGSSIIQLGDLEAHHPADLIYLDEILTESGIQMYALRGNHDNPKFWLSPNIWQGGLRLRSLTLLDEVDCLIWGSTRIITVSGAVSVDRGCIRTERGECWPSKEGIPVDSIEKVTKLSPADILLTHTGNPETHTDKNEFLKAYSSTDEHVEADIMIERQYVQRLQLASKCRKHYYGHFHMSYEEKQWGVETRCLDICETIQLAMTCGA